MKVRPHPPNRDWRLLNPVSPWFSAFSDVLSAIQTEKFPESKDFELLYRYLHPHRTPIHFVDPPVGKTPYEHYIHHTGNVPTRQDNWHDALNALCWAAWPESKQALNQLHIEDIAQNPGRHRSPQRDAYTLLDESGLVIPYCNIECWSALINHDWRTLFCSLRTEWGSTISALPIGHALLEKGIHPYIGIVGKAIGMQVDKAYFTLPTPIRRLRADDYLANQLRTRQINSTRQLHALPVLGIPGMWPLQDAAFYSDQSHFRPKLTTGDR